MTRGVLGACGLAVALCLACPPIEAAIIVQDDFNDGYINPALWETWTRGAVVVDEIAGEAYTAASFASDTHSSASFHSTPLFGGDLDVSVEFRAPTQLSSADTSHFGLMAWSEGDHPAVHRVGIRRQRDTVNGNRYWFWWYDATDGSSAFPATVYSDDLSGAYRITREGDLFRCYYESAGSWVELGSVSHFSDPARFVFYALTDYSKPSVEVYWDNFQATADWVVPEPATAILFGTAAAAVLRRKKRRT